MGASHGGRGLVDVSGSRGRLVKLGRADVVARRERIARFFER